MEPKNLIENLIAAIEQLPDSDLAKFATPIEDAKETAALARMVVRTMSAAPPAPVGNWFVTNDDNGDLIGPFATDADAQRHGSTLSGGYELYEAQSPGAAAMPGGAQINSGMCPSCGASFINGNCPDPNCTVHQAVAGGATMVQFPGGGATATAPPAPACPDCGHPLDANGDCVNLCGQTPVQAQTFDEVMNDLHNVAKKSRPGSVISNRPPGSLYQK